MRKTIINLKEYLMWALVYIRYGLLHRSLPVYSNKNKKFVVVGNGPSAAAFPFDKYMSKGFETVCVNFFATDQERLLKIKPRYYCCIDTAFNGSYEDLAEEQKKLVDALNRVDWDMIFICFRENHLPINNDKITYHYINSFQLGGTLTKIKKKLYDRNMATHGYQNVILAVLYYLVMSRAEEIILTGVENDWHRELVVDENNEVYREMTHFYGNERLNITRAGEITKGELYKYFYYYYVTLHNYYLNAEYADSCHVEIRNSCVNSFIDVYEKVQL